MGNSCVQKEKQKLKNPHEEICLIFLNAIYSEDVHTALSCMDDFILDSANKQIVETSMMTLSKRIKSDYEGGIRLSPITFEKTIHENIPSLFFVIKIQSQTKFGYYFFMVNEKNHKILLVSEFGRTKDRR